MRMPTDNEKAIAIGAGLAVAGALILALKAKGQEPDMAMLYGLVTDAETGLPIKDINVNCNGYTGKTNARGEYQIINIEPGLYPVTFFDPLGRYASLTL